MSNTGTGGSFFQPGSRYATELEALRHTLDTAEVVGHPRRDGELDELRRLVKKYVIETQQILADLDDAP